MKRFKHWIAHLFGWNYGDVEAWYEGDILMVGFKCKGCGKLGAVDKYPVRGSE